MMNGASKGAWVFFLALTGCATSSGATGPAVTESGPTSAPTYSYALAGGDKIRVIVFNEPDLGGEYTVSGTGAVSLPLIGEVQVAGMTSTELQQTIATDLDKEFIKDPRVAVELLTARPFFILGEVNHPGEYPFSDGLTISAAVARAGGYTYRATTRAVSIKHAGQDKAGRYPLAAGTPVAPGDTIMVMERWF